jgi:hypothetical protein
VSGRCALLAAGANGLGLVGVAGDGVVPGLGAEQAPLGAQRGVVTGHLHTDGDLAVGAFARGAGVLAGHARGCQAVLWEAGVIDDVRVGVDRIDTPTGQSGAPAGNPRRSRL